MQRSRGVAHLTRIMRNETQFTGGSDADGHEAAIRQAIDNSPPMPRDPVRTRILQSANGQLAMLAALQFATSGRKSRQA